ncbi:enoyl-CoA hydratase-related protein [Nocardioides massiliensis]|uniref:Enoyl-CoA hydratase/carnithine racemase n=1 Tax=Nocardioides massiliensis TaxID=1325935 RepID=A0ABT9NKM2_9ACTN|nr:enoyl-CoA hydratase-related protein [Nocardioides massiliensis]MDP9820769.1 enoyl-CoA hydratase/carnithine racemase [Nocardioides massiliensis]
MNVTQEVRGHVLLVTLKRPDKRNAINADLAEGIEAALDRLDDDPDLWAGVITGDGSVFSAGTDLATPPQPQPRGGEYGVIRRDRSTPLIAAVEGKAVGGGFEIALACDLVVAGTSTQFSLPESRRGVVATSGALFRAAQRLPANVATEMLITGAHLTAARAHELGFVNRVTPDGRACTTALEIADLICQSSPTSVSATLHAQRASLAEAERRGWEVTAQARAAVLDSPNMREGVAAFFELREPRWLSF